MRFVGRSQSGNQLEEQRTMVTSVNSASRNLDNQLKTRRKVAKMLIAVVIMFSINFFPVHFLPVLNVSFLYFFFKFKICFFLLMDHPYITWAKDWVGGSRKWPVLLMFSTVFVLTSHFKWVGGSEKVQNYADVKYGWSLTKIIKEGIE